MAKAATIAVVGVGAALISTELIPGMLIGVCCRISAGHRTEAAAFVQVERACRLRGGSQDSRAGARRRPEQMQDVVAEARADHETKGSRPRTV